AGGNDRAFQIRNRDTIPAPAAADFFQVDTPRYEYHLTQRGRDFRMVLLALAEWGNRHFAPEGRQMQLVETATQRRLRSGGGYP
ncbi:hypothetical protein FK521_28115, partial [Klebsiella pneumoniae]|nr:hypothetical protein [Klebsiella pneumoniae]